MVIAVTGPGPVPVTMQVMVMGAALVMGVVPVTEAAPALAWATVVDADTGPVPVTALATDAVRVTDMNLVTNRIGVGAHSLL